MLWKQVTITAVQNTFLVLLMVVWQCHPYPCQSQTAADLQPWTCSFHDCKQSQWHITQVYRLTCSQWVIKIVIFSWCQNIFKNVDLGNWVGQGKCYRLNYNIQYTNCKLFYLIKFTNHRFHSSHKSQIVAKLLHSVLVLLLELT